MLHSIFFLGYIYDSQLTPSKFIPNHELQTVMEKTFPETFKKYKSHLPTRTPFSILLNMVSQKVKVHPNKRHVSIKKTPFRIRK